MSHWLSNIPSYPPFVAVPLGRQRLGRSAYWRCRRSVWRCKGCSNRRCHSKCLEVQSDRGAGQFTLWIYSCGQSLFRYPFIGQLFAPLFRKYNMRDSIECERPQIGAQTSLERHIGDSASWCSPNTAAGGFF